MTDKQVTAVIGIFYFTGAVMVLVGAFFRLQHYPNGLSLLFIGFMLGAVSSSFDTFRLKKKIKRLEEQLKQNKD
ncbi:LapA family protein [uncultured Draconibacterium sp.]|uniref:LapA family protein n=1 Tax=uncultured Draconibacterium sp. TaxID=1573823 RepID=UPI0029C69DB9|nr:LapA family protein [uncultured Draconibacterium sp.]